MDMPHRHAILNRLRYPISNADPPLTRSFIAEAASSFTLGASDPNLTIVI